MSRAPRDCTKNHATACTDYKVKFLLNIARLTRDVSGRSLVFRERLRSGPVGGSAQWAQL